LVGALPVRQIGQLQVNARGISTSFLADHLVLESTKHLRSRT